MNQLIRRFDEITLDDIPLVGGKNASLGELFHEMRGRGFAFPTASP
jgi:pyruvate,water dikinase